MLESILQLFVSEDKAQTILANQSIEIIFMVLLVTFVVTFVVHITLFNKLKKIRNYLNETNRMDIDPLRDFKKQFVRKQQEESVKVETFIQEKFSSWRVFNLPVVSLIKMIQATVSVFILIGVLGTFIGLTMSLGSINSGGTQLVEDVASVLSGIDVAFYTSIAGMGFSLIMTVIIKAFNTEYLLTDIMLKVESNLEEQEENGMGRLISVSETINNSILGLQETNQQSLQGIESSFKGFQDYTTGLQQSAEDLAKFNQGLSSNLKEFQVLFDSIKKTTDGFDKGTSKLNKNFDQLFTYFKRMDGRNERIANTFEETYEKVKEVSTVQTETLNRFEESVNDLKKFSSSILDGQEAVNNSLNTINKKSNDLVLRMADHNKEFKQIFGDDLSAKLDGITSYLGELSRDFDKLGNSIVHLPSALETINKTQTEYKHLLTDRFDELKKFNQEFNQHLKAHATDSIVFEQHLRDATNTYEQVGMKNNQLINEINGTISQLNSSFNQRENQLEANVTVLKDTLSQYVNNLEGTLGDKLDRVIRNIGDYVEMTNQGIKKEFKELRLITEEIQQSSSRYTQQTFNELNQEIQKLNHQLHSFSQEAVKVSNDRGLRQND
ncbi:MotA/TolQ/ExbB proton channel family protein [Aquibacillus rhizosphaerae]|uniref:MotA/TolQ/ExbB proton channel family protein n=1 Tax=Aquibacillus rhizosphaerae TaxID=3051431 RepID=A0ABT7L1T8_9BACI|nr:MotA/TolQ/ExbB proton channel family protein [Aquibacillus sp. LR5S19]MDL4839788.1 MotA/TolQ/ExbB proton channel family protein [Aquibacillus sp. LR5S19]